MPMPAIVQSFVHDPRTLLILVLILIDVVTGIMRALKTNTFMWSKVAMFYRSNVIPGILGYLLVYTIFTLGMDQYVPQVVIEVLNTIGATPLAAALIGSLTDNIKQYQAPIVATDMHDMLNQSHTDAQG